MLRKTLLRFGLLLISGYLLNSCSTELEVNAPYRETKVLYGVLDPTLPYQTIRIGKGFLSDGRSAYEIAKIPDSSLYRPENLDVRLFELKQRTSGGGFDTLKRYTLFTETLNTKENDGDFYAPNQLVFRTEDNRPFDNTTSANLIKYLIRVRNKISNKVSEAYTQIPGRDLAVANWAEFSINNSQEGPFTLGFGSRRDTKIKIKKSLNTALLQVSLNFKVEVSKGVNPSVKDTLIWSFKTGLENDLADINEMKFQAGSFWNFIESKLPELNNEGVLSRRFLPKESKMEVLAANLDYDNYRIVNGNYNPITQSQPVYSNISNGGLGIFCAKNRRIFEIALENSTIDTLRFRYPSLKLTR